mmetsp:Transcript_47109/g.94297  ORF Transcript_47109/g.94297 Transcript_47109/m.94297 type:complete len:411 (-) Transcript_47109:60-1292(-)
MVKTADIARGVSYSLAMGLCGWLVVSLGVTNAEMASRAGLPGNNGESGSVFLTRSATMVLATLLGPAIYQGFEDEVKLCTALGLIALVMVLSSEVHNSWMLHMWYAVTGLLHAATDVGTQILTRRLFGKEAAPWLAFHLFSFSLFGVFASMIYFLPDLWWQDVATAIFAILAAAWCIGVRLIFGNTHAAEGYAPKEDEGILRWEMKWKGLEIDWLLMTVVFWSIAGQAGIAVYIYVDVGETHQVSDIEVGWLMCLFWTVVALSRLLTFFQALFWQGQAEEFMIAICACSSLGTLFSLLWALGPIDDPNPLRIGLLGYALFYAPIPSCAYILSSKLGARTDQTAAMSILGLNLGAGLGPWAVSVVFEFAGPRALPIIGVVCSVMPGLTMLGVAHYAQADKGVRDKDYEDLE